MFTPPWISSSRGFQGHRGSVPALTALAACARIFKGGTGATAQLLARHVVQVAEQLLSKLSRSQELLGGWVGMGGWVGG